MMTKDDAVKWLDNLTQDIGQMRHQDLWDYAQALSFISQMIEEMPDIIEDDGIVMCKDCKYYEKYESCIKESCMNADGECKRDIGGYPADVPMDCNDFCSKGVRDETDE